MRINTVRETGLLVGPDQGIDYLWPRHMAEEALHPLAFSAVILWSGTECNAIPLGFQIFAPFTESSYHRVRLSRYLAYISSYLVKVALTSFPEIASDPYLLTHGE